MDKKFKIFVIIAISFLGIAIAVATFFILSTVSKSKEATVKTKTSMTNLSVVDLKDAIATNVFDEQGEQHITRAVISFGVDEKDKTYKVFQKAFNSKNVVIRDQIIHIMREQTYEMMTKPDAQTKLGDEIVARINKLLDTQVIKEVYFGDFFVQ